jgi:Xaa-Pro aminopeptidase
LPHAMPGKQRISDSSFLLVDWGAETIGGYKSDLTRILVTGKIPPKLEKIYRVVLNAQQEAIQKIRPGAKCADIDAAARNIIEQAGFGKFFGHGLGHSFGLNIHESPRFSPISTDELKPGMILTVEPGIYLPQFGGVRIEDDVLVTKDGHEVLTSIPKQFEEVVLTLF